MIDPINTDTLVALFLFQNISSYFLMITWMKNVNNFQRINVQPQIVTKHCQTFWQFQPGVGYESVAYKKKHVSALKD